MVLLNIVELCISQDILMCSLLTAQKLNLKEIKLDLEVLFTLLICC